ncbi:MAG: two component transcriptional regulator, LuxR family [Thermoleophilia bacterium]|nr:two component transcriptional regulator, LuxR family [Thermoleophilia bacterium]
MSSEPASHPTSPLRCVIADDVDAMRDVIRMSLDALDWVVVCGEATDGTEALAEIERLQPDVAILDMRMPRMSGFTVAAKVRELALPVSIIIFSAFSDDNGTDPRAATLDAQHVNKLDGVPALHEALTRVRDQRSGAHG